MWAIRARYQYWIQKEWPIRETLEVSMPNIMMIQKTISRGKATFPSFSPKLGFMKQFICHANWQLLLSAHHFTII